MVGTAPAGAHLVAKATPIHVGKSTSVWNTLVATSEGKLLSQTSQTQMVLR